MIAVKNSLKFNWKGGGTHVFRVNVSFWLRNSNAKHLAQCNNICPRSSLDTAYKTGFAWIFTQAVFGSKERRKEKQVGLKEIFVL